MTKKYIHAYTQTHKASVRQQSKILTLTMSDKRTEGEKREDCKQNHKAFRNIIEMRGYKASRKEESEITYQQPEKNVKLEKKRNWK